jgi:PleD family two-component response regulator
VSRLRDHVRPSDLVGRLGNREIGMLLHNTSSSGAGAVTDRLRQALDDADSEVLAGVTMGYASREPGMPAAQLAQQARNEARRAVDSSEVRRTT